MAGKNSILVGGIIGLGLLIIFGIYSSDVILEYSEPAVEEEPIIEVEPAVEEEQIDFAPGEGLELSCSAEIDKDGDGIPDNLDVVGSVDWSNCNLLQKDLSYWTFDPDYLPIVAVYLCP